MAKIVNLETIKKAEKKAQSRMIVSHFCKILNCKDSKDLKQFLMDLLVVINDYENQN